jgi:hypothetical protein
MIRLTRGTTEKCEKIAKIILDVLPHVADIMLGGGH